MSTAIPAPKKIISAKRRARLITLVQSLPGDWGTVEIFKDGPRFGFRFDTVDGRELFNNHVHNIARSHVDRWFCETIAIEKIDEIEAKLVAMVDGTAELSNPITFGYEDVDNQLVTIASEVAKTKAKGIETILQLGQLLTQAHDVLAGAGRDGAFKPWVQEQCGFTPRSAYNYMAASKVFGGKCETVSHLFDAKAVYLLSADTCPEAATKKAIRLAGSGERITHAVAKEITGGFTVEQEPETPPIPRDDDHDFDIGDAEVELCESIRETATQWPQEYRERLSYWLTQLAQEVLKA